MIIRHQSFFKSYNLETFKRIDMANLKSQKKRILTNEIARQRNVTVRSRLKTFGKKIDEAIASKDADAINATLPTILREIDRAAKNGVLHANSAARKKSHVQVAAAAALKG
jgi:small subunit ribosomal protein S20